MAFNLTRAAATLTGPALAKSTTATVRINYTDLSSTGPVDLSADDPDAALDAELASFATFGEQLAASDLPGQLDLTDLTHHLTNSDSDSDSEGQR